MPSTEHEPSILIVDDDPATRELVAAHLRRKGFDVREAASGEAALELMEGQAIGLVILDLGLPGMSGLDVVRALREQPKTAALPIMVLTGKGLDYPLVTSLGVGADAYLTKPVRLDELVARVRARLRSQRVATEQALREKEELYRELIEKSGDGILVSDASARYVEVNPALCRMLGYSREQVLGMHAGDLTADDDPVGNAGMDARLVAATDEAGILVERRYRKSDGTSLPVEVRFNVLPDGRQQRNVRDITERKHLEAERALLAAAVEQAADFVIVVGPKGNIVSVNPAFERLTGYQPGDAIGRSMKSLLRSDVDPPEVYAARDEALRRGEAWSGRLVERRADGGHIEVDLSVSPIRDAAGDLMGSVEIGRDRTHERELEAEREREAQIRVALAESLAHVPARRHARAGRPGDLRRAGDAAVRRRGDDPDLPRRRRCGDPRPERAARLPRDGGHPPASGPGGDRARTGGSRSVGPLRGQRSRRRWIAGGGTPERPQGTRLRADRARRPRRRDARPRDVRRALRADTRGADAGPRLLRHDLERAARRADARPARAARPARRPRGRPRRPRLPPGLPVDRRSRDARDASATRRSPASTRGSAPTCASPTPGRSGLGPELELATLEAAVAAGKELPAGTWLDLNVSPRLLADPGRLREILWSADRALVLEVTEHELIGDYDALRAAVRELGHDIRLAVDDAGAGIANFGHIIDLRPDFVKLDISLVRRVNANLGRQAMVVGMRHFCRTAGCRLIAEGIETEEEAATLRVLGVEFGQGYLFGHPEPVETWVAARTEGQSPTAWQHADRPTPST